MSPVGESFFFVHLREICLTLGGTLHAVVRFHGKPLCQVTLTSLFNKRNETEQQETGLPLFKNWTHNSQNMFHVCFVCSEVSKEKQSEKGKNTVTRLRRVVEFLKSEKLIFLNFCFFWHDNLYSPDLIGCKWRRQWIQSSTQIKNHCLFGHFRPFGTQITNMWDHKIFADTWTTACSIAPNPVSSDVFGIASFQCFFLSLSLFLFTFFYCFLPPSPKWIHVRVHWNADVAGTNWNPQNVPSISIIRFSKHSEILIKASVLDHKGTKMPCWLCSLFQINIETILQWNSKD